MSNVESFTKQLVPVTSVRQGDAILEQGTWARVVAVTDRGDYVNLDLFTEGNSYPYDKAEKVVIQKAWKQP